MKVNKKLFATIAMCALSIFIILTGCGVKTESMSHTYDENYKVTLEVPKDHGYKFNDNKKKSFGMYDYHYDFSLKGDKAELYFSIEPYVYNTSIYFKDEYPDLDKDNPNFDDYLKVLEKGKKDYKLVKIGGRKAVRFEERGYVGKEKDKLLGYLYIIDIHHGDGDKKLQVKVLPKDKKTDVKKFIDDDEVTCIIDSIKFKSFS